MKNRQTSNGVIAGNGINGSLRKREVTQPQQHTEYYLFNSQGNLKAYSDDIMDFAYYGYNAANTRTYKLSLYNTNLWINGQQQPLHLQLQQAMFYPNTYLNFNGNGEYTKHYYNGTERIASRLGDNTTTIAINNNILEARKLQLEEQFREDIHKLIEETVPIDLPPFIDVNALQPTGTPNDIYYYHPNHLGSTSFVTDQNQNITQGFLYAPFGEITTEYNINFGNNVIPKYSFNAKELDEETGMYYYEARYYKPPTFISRDPLMSEKTWLSPYHYCSNNPVGRVDPTGMLDDWYRSDETGSIFWKQGSEDFVEKNGERFRNIGETFSQYLDGYKYDYYQDQLVSSSVADPNLNLEGGQYIPSQFTTDNGNVVKVTFSPSSNNAISPDAVSGLIKSINDANNNGANITSIKISSTTNHPTNATRSAHTVANGARALDISRINGVAVSKTDIYSPILQQSIAKQSNWLENYGPSIIQKMNNGTAIPAPWARDFKGGHYDHVHFSVKRR